MKELEAKTTAIGLLSTIGIILENDILIIPENIDFENALNIESKIEDIEFKNSDNLDCVFQIINDKFIICEA